MIIVSLILALIAGGLVGGGMLLADKVGFYLIILIPIIGGTIIGIATALPYLGRLYAAAQAPRIGGGLADVVVRDDRPGRLSLAIVAILGTIVAVTVYWAGSYLTYVEEVVGLLLEQDPSATRQDALNYIALVEQENTGTTGFPSFVQFSAEQGITINRARGSSSSSGINLQGPLAYAYWVVEILLMAGFAIGTAFSRARGQQVTPKPAAA